jgi:RNA polymerase primary sigma factor
MSTDNIEFIKNQIGRYPLLTPTQEIELARQVQEGVALKQRLDGKAPTRQQLRILRRGDKARDKMICCNLRLALYVATKWRATRRGRASSFELVDLFQLGCLGLASAVERFDPARGYKFSTYAYWWIRQSIQRVGGDTEWLIRLPADKRDQLGAVLRVKTELGPSATLEEVLAAANCTKEAWDLISTARLAHVSLDAPVHGDEAGGTLMHELIADTSNNMRSNSETRLRAVHEAIERIPHATAQFVLKAHYGLCGEPRDMKAIGDELGLSRERVRQLKEKGLNQLRLQVHRYDTELRYEVA